MECFIKKIWRDKGEEAHSYFTRFGRGSFEGRALLSLQKTSKIKLKGSFEWANDFVKIISELTEARFSGIILSKEKLSELAEFPSKKKAEVIEYDVSNISSEKIREIEDKVYCMLLDVKAEGISLRIKKKLPKPGKSRGQKIDNKFCQLEAELKYWPQIRDAFMLPECKKCRISHTFTIEELILPEGEKDFVRIREKAKKKGKVIRRVEVDGQERKEEKEFVA